MSSNSYVQGVCNLTPANASDENGNAVFCVGSDTWPIFDKKIIINKTSLNELNAKSSLVTDGKTENVKKTMEKKKKHNHKTSDLRAKKRKTDKVRRRNHWRSKSFLFLIGFKPFHILSYYWQVFLCSKFCSKYKFPFYSFTLNFTSICIILKTCTLLSIASLKLILFYRTIL